MQKNLNTTHLDCCYSDLNPNKGKLIEKSTCKKFNQQANIASKYIKVICNYKGKLVYEDYFIFPAKLRVRRKKVLNRYNVLILGLRSVSIINAYRKLSKFLNYLRYEMEVVEYTKYNAVSLNWINREALQNIIPLYTGMAYEDALKAYNQKHLNFIWEQYKREGYKILLAEDCVEHGVFRQGILQNVTANYNFSPFMKLYERLTGHISNGDCYICTSSKKSYKVVLDHYTSWSESIRENREKHFAMLWINSLTTTQEAHKGLNMLEIAAQDLISFFKTLKVRRLLEDTMVFIISDRGYMNNELYSIKQFKTEMKLPLLHIFLPIHMKVRQKRVVNQFMINRDKLVTPYDVHRTLETIVKFNTINFTYVQTKQKSMAKGISLFDKVPHRYCESIGVNSDTCACKYIAKYHRTKG
ncbi:Protein of unknown function (DUF229) [Popillia japonica]|uniref:Uncharacterized protein n=1 Tax=Popillia japonica TaxID=7064 RepID=A0AAW1JFV7_POPJA